MKKGNVLVIVLIFLAVTGVVIYQYSDAKKTGPVNTGSQGAKDGTVIGWEDMQPGLARAKAEGKPVFLYFHADWCTYCVKLKKTTFKDKSVLAYLAQNFVSISVDTDKHREVSEKWRVTGLPTLWFLTPDGGKISKIPGYVGAEQMTRFLAYIHTKQYEQMSFNEFIKTM